MAESYVRNSSGFQQANQIFVNVSGTYQEVNEAYANVGGTYQLVFSAFEATSFVTLSTGSGTFVAPNNSNAIHIQAAVVAVVQLVELIMIKQVESQQELVVVQVHTYQIKYFL